VAYTARRSLEQTVSDDQVQRLVEDALDWADPSVDGSRIGVTVDKGVITLRGTVDTPPEKLTAERVAQRVRGVETVINHLAVSSLAETKRAGWRQGERDPSRAAGP
jgi:osmotically-inducible protein OsmY